MSGFLGAVLKFGTVFAVTQVPLAIAEGFLTVIVIDALAGKVPDAEKVDLLASGAR